MFRLCAQGLAEMEELDSLLCEDEDTPGCDTPAGAGPASVEADPQGARRADAKASAAGRNRLKALRTRMVQQVQLLFNELDRHGGAERLEASASRGAGSTDHRAADDFAGRFGGCTHWVWRSCRRCRWMKCARRWWPAVATGWWACLSENASMAPSCLSWMRRPSSI